MERVATSCLTVKSEDLSDEEDCCFWPRDTTKMSLHILESVRFSGHFVLIKLLEMMCIDTSLLQFVMVLAGKDKDNRITYKNLQKYICKFLSHSVTISLQLNW